MNNVLVHHGVKGQKWGVRRYQNKNGTYTPEGKYRLKKYTSPGREWAKSRLKSKARRVAREFIPGVSQVLTVKSLLSLRYLGKDKKDYTKKEGAYEKLSELKKKTSPTDMKDDLKRSNPRLGMQKGKINNCTYCSVALEMRARGYDVQARSKGYGADPRKLYATMFDGVKMNNVSTQPQPKESRKEWINRGYDNLCRTIEKQGEGARGYVGLNYQGQRTGHAMYWKVEKGRVHFYDGQNGKSDTGTDKAFALSDPRTYEYCRLDNLKLKKGVTEAVVSRKDKRGDKHDKR